MRKLEKVLTQRVPLAASIELEDIGGIIGVIRSAEFAGTESIGRQSLIGDLIATSLTPEERRRVQVIVGVTPDEGTGYLAGEEKRRGLRVEIRSKRRRMDRLSRP